MRVSIGSIGPFHAFDLARQLETRGHLGTVYTGYPKWKVDHLPPKKIQSFPWFMVPKMFLGKIGAQGLESKMNWLTINTFDRWMVSNLKPCEVFHCLSSFGLWSHRVAKNKFQSLTICDRASSHILHQDETLAEEYSRWGCDYIPIDRRIVDRELQEYEECDHILVPSNFVYRSFLKKGISEQKIIKIPFGVDLSMFRPVAKADKVFRVIYVGALSLRKGIQYLLEAIGSINLPNIELWLIGAISLEVRPWLAKYEERFRYFGIIPRNELYKYYSQGSVLVLASIEEGLAYVQAQAMACGLPVIATTNTGAEDLFSDGVEGFIVPIRDVKAIQEKIVFLYENPQVRDQMAAAALNRVRKLGGWNTYGEQVLLAYQTALKHREAKRANTPD